MPPTVSKLKALMLHGLLTGFERGLNSGARGLPLLVLLVGGLDIGELAARFLVCPLLLVPLVNKGVSLLPQLPDLLGQGVALDAAVSAGGSVTVTETVSVQPLASETTKVWMPAGRVKVPVPV